MRYDKKLNFGCGTDLRDGWDNVDMQNGPNIITFDFDNFPYPLKKNHYDYVLMKSIIEHLIYPDRTLLEIYKCCKNGAIIDIITDHYTNKGAYNSLQHKGFFNENVFTDFVEANTLINKKEFFKIISIEVTPTIVGKLLPKWFRNKLSLFINGLHSQIHVRYKVIKDSQKLQEKKK